MLTYGAEKYAPDNWRKGFDWRSIVGSLKRHLTDFEEGMDYDDQLDPNGNPGSGLPHLAHIACNVAFLIEHFDKGLGRDDRIKNERLIDLIWNKPPQAFQ